MIEKNITSDKIKRANRQVYNNISPEAYDTNESIFNEHRKRICTETLQSLAAASGKERFLDIGTGTGNILRIAEKIFDRTCGSDISDNLIARIRDRHLDCLLVCSDAEEIPFKDATFNCVSCYALLHHLFSHEKIFSEIFRILKPGGSVYTDHDPNYFFNRFYRIFYRIKYRNRPGFGSDLEEMAEYHNTISPGINPEKLKDDMARIGYTDIVIKYRLTDRPNWNLPMGAAVGILGLAGKIIGSKSFFTHFSITARKPEVAR